jgi:integrase
MAVVAMCTGLRISEVLALRWEHIDFQAGTMLVQRGVVNGRIGKNKTEASKAEIPLDESFARALLDWKATQPLAAAGLVFPSPVTGGCFHAGMIMKKHIKPAAEAIGLKDVGWHSFRHSYRGMLNDTGANTGTQQSLMRHASVSTTMNVYGRAGMKAKSEANSKVVQMILPRKELCA